MKILLVDDSRTIRNIQKNVLAQLGYSDVIEAADGVEALAMISAQKPDMILVDWNMPNMDGITMVRKVREFDKATPMLMVTTEAEKARVIEAIRAGVNNYVVKPFTAETLAEKINQTLAKLKGVPAAAAPAVAAATAWRSRPSHPRMGKRTGHSPHRRMPGLLCASLNLYWRDLAASRPGRPRTARPC